MTVILFFLTTLLLFAGAILSGDDAATEDLYEEDVATSHAVRTRQARELERYITKFRDDPAILETIFTPNYASNAAYEKSTRRLRSRLEESLGYPPPGAPDDELSEFKLIGEDSLALYYRMRGSVLPGVHVVGLFLVPHGRAGRLPLVVAQHGGGGSPELATFHGGANYHDMVRGAARQGYAVWVPQMLFTAEEMPADIRQRVDSRARLVGTTLMAIEIAKISRGLDVVLRRPEVDRHRVGMVGLSYGGLYTLHITALEPRIKAAVSSCWFGDQVARLDTGEPYCWSDIRFSHNLNLFRDPQIVALICPRPLEIQMGKQDDLFAIEPARRLSLQAAAYYKGLKMGNRFRFVEFDGGHEFHGASAWEFLAKHL